VITVYGSNNPSRKVATKPAQVQRRVPPPSAASAHFSLAVELEDGWCALTDSAASLLAAVPPSPCYDAARLEPWC
jgi:hypothetical protein